MVWSLPAAREGHSLPAGEVGCMVTPFRGRWLWSSIPAGEVGFMVTPLRGRWLCSFCLCHLFIEKFRNPTHGSLLCVDIFSHLKTHFKQI